MSINHNILHLIVRKLMDSKPHPLARIMRPLYDEIITLINGPTLTSFNFRLRMAKLKYKYELKSEMFIFYYLNIFYPKIFKCVKD